MNALSLELEQRADQDGVTLSVANALLARSGLEMQPDFLETVARNYGA